MFSALKVRLLGLAAKPKLSISASEYWVNSCGKKSNSCFSSWVASIGGQMVRSRDREIDEQKDSGGGEKMGAICDRNSNAAEE
jgi:hypothetical protein